jgi:hypothetical protein
VQQPLAAAISMHNADMRESSRKRLRRIKHPFYKISTKMWKNPTHLASMVLKSRKRNGI